MCLQINTLSILYADLDSRTEKNNMHSLRIVVRNIISLEDFHQGYSYNVRHFSN